MKSQIEHARTPILIVGGGPVGSLLALSLSHFHQPCTLVEASLTTTPWPKMEQINGRTMEVLRILGLAEKLRNTRGVPKPMPHGQSSITLGLETWNLNFLVWCV
jgi:2-polyprenyl-6-methoxyphenol hydroxylase-like FAD-dependent oxidoreductase